MPGPEYAGTVVFYEDFPYAYWNEFRHLGELGIDLNGALGSDVSLTPTYADVTDQEERKIRGIALYESQIERLFDDDIAMAKAVRAYHRTMAEYGRVDGAAERYWVTGRV